MKCKECDSCTKGRFDYMCMGVKEPFVIKDINQDCTEYPKITITRAHTYDDVKNAIDFLNNQIRSDLKELDGDRTSEFAKMLLAGHRNINVTIKVLEKELANIMLAYTE